MAWIPASSDDDDPAFRLAEALNEAIAAPTNDLDLVRQQLQREPDLRSFELQARQALGAAFDPSVWNEAVRMLRERTLDSMICSCEEELEEIAAERHKERSDEDWQQIAAQTKHVPQRPDDDYISLTAAERELAAMILNEIPRDIWDACVAAFGSGDEDGQRTAREIFARWKKES